MSYKDFLSRFEMMLTEEQIEKLSQSSVLLFGVGGVGGAVAYMLARCGVSRIGVVDFDTIDITNLNRQAVAYQDNIGKSKVDEISRQLKNINPNIEIVKYPFKLDENSIDNVNFDNYKYIVDCIDDISAKKLLIKRAYNLKKPILCAMGAGNRFEEIPNFEIEKIEKTSYDPIAKILRKYCAENGIKNLQVCYTKQKSHKFNCQKIGSVVYYVVNMASVITAKVINDLLK